MPTVLVEKGYYFRFYASDMGEPPHIHVVRGRKRAKIRIQDMSLAYNRGFKQHEITNILKIMSRNKKIVLEAWNAFFS